MNILIVSNYYYPETVGCAVWLRQLTADLRDQGHKVTVLTSFPSYPAGKIFPGYESGRQMRETIDGIDVIRTCTYATTSKAFWARIASWGTFCLSSLFGGLAENLRPDVVYAILPPLPLGVSAWALARAAGARLVVNIQDIYPDIAVATGYLKNPMAVRFFRYLESWIYRRADQVVVISQGFSKNLEQKQVHTGKLSVVPNWADPGEIVPGDRDNPFRREVGGGDKYLVLYSGTLSVNSDLTPVIDAAQLLRNEPFQFVVVGDGVQKAMLIERAERMNLRNLAFLPFQPLERYPEVMAAADVTLVSLNSAATFASVPSKIYKQMAAARPIVALSNPGNELSRLLEAADCGAVVPPGEPAALAGVLREGLANRSRFEQMGWNGRTYLERECSRSVCVRNLERVLRAAHEHAYA